MTNTQIDFVAEINTLFQSHDFNFGKGAIPVDIVTEAVLKSVCGLANGSTAQSIIVHLGYVKYRNNNPNGRLKLTDKGKEFLWWAMKKNESSQIANKAKRLFELMQSTDGTVAYGSMPNSDILISLERVNAQTPAPSTWPEDFPWPLKVASEIVLGPENEEPA